MKKLYPYHHCAITLCEVEATGVMIDWEAHEACPICSSCLYVMNLAWSYVPDSVELPIFIPLDEYVEEREEYLAADFKEIGFLYEED